MKLILLIGLGRFGQNIIETLNEFDHEVMAIDKNEERVDAILPLVTNAQIGDSTNQDFLETLGIRNFDVCIVAIAHDFQSSLETTSLLKDLGARLVVSRAETATQRKFLLRNGADYVVYPEEEMARWTAIRYSSDHILDYVPLDDKHSIFEVSVPERWANKSIGKINVRREHGINIMAVKRGEELDLDVTPDTLLTSDMTLLVFGDTHALYRTFGI